MDKIVKGMSEAGQHPQECCNRQERPEGLFRRMAHSLRGAVMKIGQALTGRHEIRSGSAR
jgi:hypothetical protein